VPATAAALVMIATAWAGVHQVAAVAGFGLATLVFVTSGQEILRGPAIGRRGMRSGAFRVLARGRRRHAGLVVHLGLALVAAGIIASSSLAQQTQVTLKTGQSTVFAGQVLRYQGLHADRQPQRIVFSTTVSVTNPGGGPAGTLDPRMNLYPAATAPIGSPSIRRGIVWDLYASLISLQDNGGSATFRFYHNPGVNWLWLGGLVMALGGAAAAWPARRRSPRDDRGASVTRERAAVEVGAR
jgi:cytochrome c-type biogenesis protein CcmF